jgi:hypothetical protein
MVMERRFNMVDTLPELVGQLLDQTNKNQRGTVSLDDGLL